MGITAEQVKELRERTGAGMMECKKALVASDGNLEAAIDAMRKSGQAKAEKRAGKVAAEGVIAMAIAPDARRGVMVEVNAETDFVAKEEGFRAFATQVADRALESQAGDLDALLRTPMENNGPETMEERRQALMAKIGEKIAVRRVAALETQAGVVGAYLHHGGRIGVLLEMTAGDAALAKEIAMHVAANQPLCVREEEIPEAIRDKEREIYRAQAAESGKPPAIVEKMVEGRMKKFIGEVTLLGQPFVKDPDVTVAKYLGKSGATVTAFTRFAVGEGLEKKTENFADEVRAQVKGG